MRTHFPRALYEVRPAACFPLTLVKCGDRMNDAPQEARPGSNYGSRKAGMGL
jgi:hypothetical protein